jgi:hypothetical protein
MNDRFSGRRRCPRAAWWSALGLIALATSAAAADRGTYLFGLTEAEIREAVSRYAPQADPEEALKRLSAPFDCRNFDDLCDDVGEDAAPELLEGAFGLARRQVTPEDLESLLELKLERARIDRSKQRGPALEVGEVRLAASTVAFTGCGGVPNIATDTNGNFSLRVQAGVTNLVIYVSTWTSAKHFHNGVLEATDLCVSGIGFAQSQIDGSWFSVPYGPKCKDRKKVTANANWFNLGALTNFHSEGCGQGNNMYACACR